MILTLLNESLQAIEIIETFSSLIWTDRYDECGDFELLLPVTTKNISIFQKGRYLTLDTSEHVMRVETIETISNAEDGDNLKVLGRSLESILDQRIVWSQTILSGNLQTEAQRLLNENAIAATITARNITKLQFQSSIDTAITTLTVEGQYTGDLLYTVIAQLCRANKIGFRITLNSLSKFVFNLYSGKDRSYSQIINPYVVFSPSFENIIESDYFTTDITLKTVALVAGEGEGSDRLTTTATITTGAGSDLARREMYVDARDLSKTTDSGTLPDADYLEQLNQRGLEQLAENAAIDHFDGEIDTTTLFTYGVDFFMGDIIQISNQYGQGGRSRITELIFSQSESGTNIRPTLKSMG